MSGILTSVGVSLLTSTPAAAVSVSAIVTNVPDGVTAVATDPSGVIFVGADDGNVYAWSPTTTALYDTNIPADTLTSLTPGGVGQTFSLDYHNGDLWISDSADGLQVLSPTTTTLYGVSVTADTPTTIVAATSSVDPTQVTFDSSNDLFFADSATTAGDGSVDIDPVASGTIFDQNITADQVHPLIADLNQPDGVALDSSGDLFFSDDSLDYIGVLPVSSGTVFGQPVNADTASGLFYGVVGVDSSSGLDAGPLDFDSSGDLYFVNLYTGVGIVTNTTGTYIGTQVTDDTPTNLDLEMDVEGIAFQTSGQLLMADGDDAAIVSAAAPTATITNVSISGSLDNPTLTVTGTGFGTEPAAVAPGCSASGNDYSYSTFVLSDSQQQWQAGMPGDCVAFNIVSYNATQVVATFGSWYTDQEVGSGTEIHPGDNLWVGLAGAYAPATVPGVTSVVPDTGPDSGGTTVTISGEGFTGATAVDFGPGNPASFTVDDDNQITATSPATGTGTVDVTVTTPVGTSATSSADQFTFTNDVASDYSCTVPGDGTNSFAIEVTESPKAPTSEDVGTNFEEAPSVEVTIPAPVVEYYIGQGAFSLNLESQSATENGLASPDGAASGAVSPNSESSSANDVPQTFSPLSDSSITYQTTYDPVTWQTGPGTGTVYLTPGDINIVLTYDVDSTPESSQVSCSPPSNEAAVDTTTVEPAATSPTYQVPTSTPPVQSGVTSGNDDGWTFVIANTSDDTVTGLQTQVTITDGGTPPSFDTTAISASGTKDCTVTSPGVLTCTENDLDAGATDTINVLVDTSGLTQGVGVEGSASVTSTNAGSAGDSLGQFSVVVVNNGVESSAVPGIALASSSLPLSDTGAAVTLTLPKNKIPVAGPHASGAVPDGSAKTKPPVVGVTLEPVPESDEPTLCPPASGGCPTDVLEVEGTFTNYVNAAHPLIAVLQYYFGSSKPKGPVYMLEDSGTVLALGACVQSKKTGDWNTPCVDGAQKTTGSKGKGTLSVEDIVYFTGNDPGFSLR
ncbi:MAG: IPT/TIG domain-containing protein [Acidimicrobiales bacterium]